MLVCGLDFETTGIQPTASVIEVGLVLWDTTIPAPVRVTGYLVNPGEAAVWETGVQELNKITPALCVEYGTDSLRALKQVLLWIQQADVVCAHNGLAFDRPVLKRWAEEHGLDWFPDKFWIDTMQDLRVASRSSNRLSYMAADNGFLNPFPHRAVFDVMTMLKLLSAHPIEQVIAYAKTPWVGAKVTLPFEKNQWAKDNGYFWYKNKENDRIKFWMKKVKEDKFADEEVLVRAAGFILTKIEVPEGVY